MSNHQPAANPNEPQILAILLPLYQNEKLLTVLLEAVSGGLQLSLQLWA